jgi:hypothetical protein
MDERNLESEQAAPRYAVDQLRTSGLELLERPREVLSPEGDMVHAGAAPGEEAPDRGVLAGRGDELEASVSDEDRGGLDTLVFERLPILEPRGEEPLVRRDRLVEVDHRDAEVMDTSHAGDAIRARAPARGESGAA